MFQNGRIGDEVVINTGGGSEFCSHISAISEFNGKFSIFIPEEFRYGWDAPGYRHFNPVTVLRIKFKPRARNVSSLLTGFIFEHPSRFLFNKVFY